MKGGSYMIARMARIGSVLIMMVAISIAMLPAPTLAEKTKVTLAFAGTYEMNLGIVEAVQQFEAAHPNIEVELLPSGSGRDYYDRLTVMAIGGTSPDIALVAYQFLPPYIEMGVLRDLKPFLNRVGGLSENDFVPIVLDSLTFDGKLYAIPRDFTPISMFINVDMFDQSGLALPDADEPLTTDEYLEIGHKLVRDFGGDGLRDRYLAASVPWTATVQVFGGQLWDHYRTPTRSTADDFNVMEALEWVRDLRLVEEVVPPYGQGGFSFANGNVATLFTGRYEVPNLRNNVDFEWDIRPFYVNRVRRPEHGGSGWMSFHTDSPPEAVWALLSWLGGPEGQAIEMESGRIVPALISLLRSSDFLFDHPPFSQQVWLADMQQAARPLFLEWQSSMDLINPVVNRFMQGGLSSRWAVTEIEQIINTRLQD